MGDVISNKNTLSRAACFSVAHSDADVNLSATLGITYSCHVCTSCGMKDVLFHVDKKMYFCV